LARRQRGGCGGILGLLTELEAYEDPIRADLLAAGLRWDWIGTDRLTWADLRAFLGRSRVGSAYHWAKDADSALWGLREHLLAHVADLLAVGNWQRAGKKRGRRPEPISRPGAGGKKKYGRDPVPAKDFNAWWDSGLVAAKPRRLFGRRRTRDE
jgi:hypothetical protein